MEYITSDLHFGHNNICGADGFCDTRTHFSSTAEMDEHLISALNSVLTNDDILYHLGDLSMNLKNPLVFEILTKINGQIHLVKGNHDSTRMLNYLARHNYKLPNGRDKFVFYQVGKTIKRNGKTYYLTHYPLGLGEQRKKLRSLCGHIHEEEAKEANVLNVGVDSPELPVDHPFGVPLSLDTAIGLVEAKWSAAFKKDFS